MEDRVVPTVGVDVDDATDFRYAALGVLDAVADCWIVRTKLASANDEFEISGLVKTFKFFWLDFADKGANSCVGFGACYATGSGIVGFGCAGLDVGDVLAEVGQQRGGNRLEYVVD